MRYKLERTKNCTLDDGVVQVPKKDAKWETAGESMISNESLMDRIDGFDLGSYDCAFAVWEGEILYVYRGHRI